MALNRKSTKLEGLDSTLQQYHEYATPYAFAYIKTPVGIKQNT